MTGDDVHTVTGGEPPQVGLHLFVNDLVVARQRLCPRLCGRPILLLTEKARRAIADHRCPFVDGRYWGRRFT